MNNLDPSAILSLLAPLYMDITPGIKTSLPGRSEGLKQPSWLLCFMAHRSGTRFKPAQFVFIFKRTLNLSESTDWDQAPICFGLFGWGLGCCCCCFVLVFFCVSHSHVIVGLTSAWPHGGKYATVICDQWINWIELPQIRQCKVYFLNVSFSHLFPKIALADVPTNNHCPCFFFYNPDLINAIN